MTPVGNAAKVLLKELPSVYRKLINEADAKEIEEIINGHALGAAASGLAAGWVPGAGGTAALMASVGFIWSMYFRINKRLGIPFSKTIIKSLGSAVLTNLAGTAISLVGGAILATALSFTGIGNVASSIIMAGLDYAVVMVSGVIYLKLLTQLFKAGKDLNSVSAEELRSTAEQVMKSEDINQMLKDAKGEYKQKHKAGEVTGKETIDLEDDE